MCQRIIQLCSGSTKPLIFAGSFLTSILAIGLAFLAYQTNSLYQDIDPTLAQSRSLTYHLQLVASAYLILISVLACFAAHYDQKHSIRALAILTSLNFLLAVAAILMIPSGGATELGSNEFKSRLMGAANLYDYKLKPQPAITPALNDLSSNLLKSSANATVETQATTASGSGAPPSPKEKRASIDNNAPTTNAGQATNSETMNSTIATKLWDDLQNRGCCGFNNSTDWTQGLPKSCCSMPVLDSKDSSYHCNSTDQQHEQSCLNLIESISLSTKNMGLLLVLALIALINLYLANVSGISAYRTFHYDEASQNAYT